MLKSTTGPIPMRGVLSLALDPATLHHLPPHASPNENQRAGAEAGPGEGEGGRVIFYSTSSDPCIRRWYLSHDIRSAREVAPDDPLVVHETSVNSLVFLPGEEEQDAEIWTASSDGWAKCLARSTLTTSEQQEEERNGWQVETSLEHGDYVRAVGVDEMGGWIVTAGRDEDVKVWDRGTGELEVVLRGHFDEVTDLVVMRRRVVSVGIDRTVRVWSLNEEGLGKAKKVWEERLEEDGDEEEGKGNGNNPPSGLTEEEERELAELMNDDDDDDDGR